MKVLDLQCRRDHIFEGWFASEQDFVMQKESGALICPTCGDASVSKRLSAPRLNLGGNAPESVSVRVNPGAGAMTLALQEVWAEIARSVMANTDDVGSQFATEARKIHYGDVPVRGIRGKATLSETASLIEEGIAVLPLPLPEVLKNTLH